MGTNEEIWAKSADSRAALTDTSSSSTAWAPLSSLGSTAWTFLHHRTGAVTAGDLHDGKHLPNELTSTSGLCCRLYDPDVPNPIHLCLRVHRTDLIQQSLALWKVTSRIKDESIATKKQDPERAWGAERQRSAPVIVGCLCSRTGEWLSGKKELGAAGRLPTEETWGGP